MDLPVVVGVDGSEPSLRAVDWAADEAVLRGAPLRLVYASLWERYEGESLTDDLTKPSEELMAEDVVDIAAQRAHRRQPGLKVTTDLLPEEPEYALLHESGEAAALVLGSRGRSGFVEMLLGSVGLTVAALAHCPVIVLRGSHDNRVRTGSGGRIVLGVGGKEAVDFALREAELRGAEVDAVRAWRAPARETTDHPLLAGEPARLHEQQASDTLEEALSEVPEKVRVHRRTVEGPARQVLLAASHTADLVVVGARRNTGHFGLQLGRVAHGVLHHAACPVAVVPELTGVR
ncbi:universal stress protein [Streptomyces sp. NBC_01764]|uniref:universal stress protein n=1 Tax=Streptomyces sp. NBC_01764 TaxID=2975935 RepID=UPI0022534455|nr:universal stress protein [Streptomyces sp. NBC_01764]MCX4404510.1 universal stress protein [Streptomyces sp. NBC_01764]